MKASRSCEIVSVVATVSVASDSAGDTPAATELNGAFKRLNKVLMLIRAAVLLRLHSKKGSAVSRRALMLGLSLCFRYYGITGGTQVNGEQGWLCTKFRLLFPLSNVVFRHSWYARY
jgi:hypothetical protein